MRRESATICTPLGIRFWDPACDTQVREGLVVRARQQGSAHASPRAFRTLSGIYAFQGLPGLHDFEYPTEDRCSFPAPPGTKRFIIHVVDQQLRFLPVVFGMALPHKGIFPPTNPGSPPGKTLPGLHLFSAPARPTLPTLAVVRAELEDESTGGVGAHAILEVEVPGPSPKSWYGMADERGSAVVMFPYPTFKGEIGGASPVTSPAAPGGVQHTWDVTIRVRYEPAALAYLTNYEIPELYSICAQAPGVLWSTLGPGNGQPVSHLTAQLTFGQELVMRTDRGPTLLIGSKKSPP
jgi:hypothetical protein